MPESNSKKIEEILKRFSARRRGESGDGFGLHPATRKMLLDEAHRRWGRREVREEERSGLSVFWRRLAWSGPLVALAVFSGVMVFRTDRADHMARMPRDAASTPAERSLAKLELDHAEAPRGKENTREQTPAVATAAPAPAPAPAEPKTKSEPGREGLGAGAFAMKEWRKELADSPRPASEDKSAKTARAPTGGLRAGFRLAERREPGEPEKEVSFDLSVGGTPADTAAETDASYGLSTGVNFALQAEEEERDAAPARPRARKLSRPTATDSEAFTTGEVAQPTVGPVLSTVLAEFEIRTEGNRVIITDADGSVYRGAPIADARQEATDPATRVSGALRRGAAADRSREAAAYHYVDEGTEDRAGKPKSSTDRPIRFRVEGSNKTLGVPVVVTGTLSRVTAGKLAPTGRDFTGSLDGSYRMKPARERRPVVKGESAGAAGTVAADSRWILEAEVRIGEDAAQTIKATQVRQ